MKPPVNGMVFVPEVPPRAVHDVTLDRPVLLLGWWTNPAGQRIRAEVLTMAQPREPRQVRELLGARTIFVFPSAQVEP